MLVENTLFDGEIDKVQVAIERLRSFQPVEGYYLAFSGGKDSCVIKALADMAGVKYDAHYSVTTIDPPELVWFIKEHHKDVIFDRPKEPFLQALVRKGFPTRQQRWCCSLYKENGGSGRFVITGIRSAESAKRAGRRMIENCYKDSNKRYLNVIIDWTDDDVWSFIKLNNIPYCKLYDEGFKRIGCLLCPMSDNQKKEAERYPKIANNFLKAFKLMYEKKVADGKKAVERWDNGEDMFYWWISCNKEKHNPDQTVMFE